MQLDSPRVPLALAAIIAGAFEVLMVTAGPHAAWLAAVKAVYRLLHSFLP